MNQSTGTITIKRKLAAEDRDYQNLVNKSGLKNMLSNMPQTLRETGENKGSIEIIQGGLLGSNLNNNNIYEIITIPQPQFFTAKYEIVFWTNYTQHMTYLIQTYMSSFLPQFRGHKLETDKGYWFLSQTEDSFSNGENIDQFEGEERLIKYTLNVSVKGYLLAAQAPTGLVPVRRWISCPTLVFETYTTPGEIQPKKVLERPPIKDTPKDGFTLSDINVAPESKQTPTTQANYVVNKTIIDRRTGKRSKKYVSIIDSNQKNGETVYSTSDVKTIESYIFTTK